ncbi:calcium-binding and coiled-coil domain-containing protein 2 [Symphorus nematophorus]
MASSTEAAAAASGSSARTFSQVVFTDIPHSYPPATVVTCSYNLTTAFQPNPRDWVGIFKVGWSTTKDYHTFVWVEPCLDVVGQQSLTRQAVFKDYYLPKDEIEFYQFCYVDSTGQVRGASTPFCFRNPVEQSLESSPDDDLLVIQTQEQLEQSVREKAELQKELEKLMEEKEALKSALQKEQQETASLRGQNEQKEKEKSQLMEEMEQIKGQNQDLKSSIEQQQEEMDHLKEEMKQMEIQKQVTAEQTKMSQSVSLDGALRQNEEKYSRAVMKINQLKEEREGLRQTIDAQSEEISMLKAKIRELERELFMAKDSIQLVQVDLQSCEKEKERLSAELQRLQSLAHNMDNVKRENQELCRRLSEQETPQSCPDEDLRAQCQTLTSQLQDAQAKLAAEREGSKNTKTRAEYLDRELREVREQLETVIRSLEVEQRKSSKQELQLCEANEMIADQSSTIEEKDKVIRLLSHEKEELTRENQNLGSDIEELRRVYADLHAAPPADSQQQQQQQQQQQPQPQPDPSETVENLYENIGDPEEEPALVCRHCHESFPITPEELEQHEQSHRICPFCTMMCDNMEQSVFEDHVYSHEL